MGKKIVKRYARSGRAKGSMFDGLKERKDVKDYVSEFGKRSGTIPAEFIINGKRVKL